MRYDLPRLTDYCDWNTDAKCVSVGGVDLYFSYQTVVAFRKAGVLTVSENVWSRTTGKHLNAIDGGAKASRVPHDEFVRRLEAATERPSCVMCN